MAGVVGAPVLSIADFAVERAALDGPVLEDAGRERGRRFGGVLTERRVVVVEWILQHMSYQKGILVRGNHPTAKDC